MTVADLQNRVNSYDLGPLVTTNNFLIRENNDKFYHRYELIRTPQLSGRDKWKISDGSSVFSKTEKEFIYEPLPSSRTNKFIADTRFPSVKKALEAMNQYRATMTAILLKEGMTYWEGV